MRRIRSTAAIAWAIAVCSPIYSLQEKSDAATVTGIVKFKGPKPERKANEGLLGQAFCKEACAGKAPLEEKWVFGKNGGDDTFANVLVYVSKGLEGKTFEPPKAPVVLDQVACAYTP